MALPFFLNCGLALLSAHYKEDSKQLYFDQCFEIDSKIGAGSFGEVSLHALNHQINFHQSTFLYIVSL